MTTRTHLSRRQRVRIFDAAHGICHLCRQIIAVGERWDVEHLVPLSMGGTNDETNLRPAHVRCHRGKTAEEAPVRAKSDRQRANYLGIPKARKKKFPGGRDTAVTITMSHGPQRRMSQAEKYRATMADRYSFARTK